VALLVFKTSVAPNPCQVGSIPTRLRQQRSPCNINTLQGDHFFGHTLGHLFEGFSSLGLVLAQPLYRLARVAVRAVYVLSRIKSVDPQASIGA